MNTLKELLQQIHDEADHILDTKATDITEIARKNAKEIKRLAKEALSKSFKELDEIETVAEDLRDTDGYWAEHPDYPAEDWRYEVTNEDTRLGYWYWVADKVRSKN